MGDNFQMFIDLFKVEVQRDGNVSTVPIMYQCDASAPEMRDHGPQIGTALPLYERKTNALVS